MAPTMGAGMKRICLRAGRGMSVFGFVLGMTCPAVAAPPLGKEACEAAKTEHAALEAAGARDTLKKGAAWGKANLSAAKMKDIERFIGLEEQILFRCGLARLRVLPGGDGEENTDTDKTVPSATPESPPVAKVKPKAKPKVAGPKEPSPVAEVVEVPPKAKAKPKPKPKVDDAYKPPVPSPKE